MRKSVNEEKQWETVMCPKCLREVAALEQCPICGAGLKDEDGFFMRPMEPMGFGDEFLDDGSRNDDSCNLEGE